MQYAKSYEIVSVQTTGAQTIIKAGAAGKYNRLHGCLLVGATTEDSLIGWQSQGEVLTGWAANIAIGGCYRIDFEPRLDAVLRTTAGANLTLRNADTNIAGYCIVSQSTE